jgi:hypothetical protein
MAAATTKMAALNSATSSNAIDPNAEDNCDDAETGNAQESNGHEDLPELHAVVIDCAPVRGADSGPYEGNGAFAQGAAGTRNLPAAQAALLTLIRDERDPTTPTRRPSNPLPLEKFTYRIARTATEDLPERDNCRGRSYVACLHTGSA